MDLALQAAASALDVLFTPLRMGFLMLGVLFGLVIGIVPGLGGIVGLSLLLPFTFGMDAYSALAMLMGLLAAVSLGDSIPAVLFGVPGTVGCAATVMDGYPMAKRGEAGRALGAAFNASLLGGLFGALMLGVLIPSISPVVLFFGSPELVAICVFGISMVATLSGNAPLKGLAAALIGLLLSMVGEESQTGTLRYTFDSLYLWTGIPVVPVALAVFAIPELCDLMIKRATISSDQVIDARRGQLQGWKDAFRNWFLVGRTGMLGSICGIVPGLGAAVIDWLAYGHALKTEKGASESFGKGDVRGVIASESSTNAREGGALVTTIAFGVPAHASAALILGAFLIQGIVPGPNMLTKHLDLTYTIVWSLALANVIGALVCFAFTNQFARIATIRYTLLLPLVVVVVFIGAATGQQAWGDLVTLLLLGATAWTMKLCGWPRPPLVLGFILGSLIERYTFISVQRYGWEWLGNPFVVVMFALAALTVLQRIVAVHRARRRRGARSIALRPRWSLPGLLAALVLALFIAALVIALRWPFEARLMPLAITLAGIAISTLLLFGETFRAGVAVPAAAGAGAGGSMDLVTDYGALSSRQVLLRALGFFLWILGVLLGGYVAGLVPALVVSTFLFLRLFARESWLTTLVMTAGTFLFVWALFDHVVHMAWPATLAGDYFPVLRERFLWF